MSDMKCPFCQQGIKIVGERTTIMSCFNGDCKGSGLYGEKALWQELIRTRKVLDVARNGLEYIFGYENVPKYVVKHIRQVLDQIKNETALEQIEHKE